MMGEAAIPRWGNRLIAVAVVTCAVLLPLSIQAAGWAPRSGTLFLICALGLASGALIAPMRLPRAVRWPFITLAGLALSGYMSERIAAGLLVVYFLLTIEVYLATYTVGTFHLSFWKFSPTELRIVLMIGNLALLRWPMARIFGVRYPLFDTGGLVGIIGMSLMFIVAVVRHTIALYRAERVS